MDPDTWQMLALLYTQWVAEYTEIAAHVSQLLELLDADAVQQPVLRPQVEALQDVATRSCDQLATATSALVHIILALKPSTDA